MKIEVSKVGPIASVAFHTTLRSTCVDLQTAAWSCSAHGSFVVLLRLFSDETTAVLIQRETQVRRILLNFKHKRAQSLTGTE